MSQDLSALRHESTNPALKSNMEQAVSRLFPIKSDDGHVEIRATSVKIDMSSFNAHALNVHQDSRQTGKTMGAKITADLQLIRDGKTAQNLSNFSLGTLPLMNALGTFMVNGNDYYVPVAQLRLKPGAYTREKTNGEIETFVPMKGAQMSVWMDPAKGVFKIGFYSTNVGWYAIVRALGASDNDIVTALGGDKRARELLAENTLKNPEADVKKLFLAIFERGLNRDLLRAGIQQRDATLGSVDYAGQVAAIQTWMDGKTVDPYVTKKTLGTPISVMGKELLLKAAGRTLSVSRKESEADDRDSLEFKQAFGIEDLMPERLAKQTRMLQNKVLRRISKPDATLARAFGRDWLGMVTSGYFGGTGDVEGGLAHTAEAANPLAILSEQSKTTIQGEGGISSDHAITVGARLFRPGSVNFIDPVHTPEGSKIGITTHLAANVRKVGTQLKAGFYPVKDGKLDRSSTATLSAEEAADSVIGYPEFWEKDGSPKSASVRANKNGEVVEVPATEVQYVIPSGMSMFDLTSNAALFLAHTHPNRAMMAGKHLTQALPLIERELPLADMQDHKGRDVLKILAKSFVRFSDVDGTVEKVEPDRITISGVVHQIYDHYPMQAKVALHHIPVVKVGDHVKKGDVIADSNYSKDGKLALGTNLRSAYMPWKGASNFEDSIVVSESAAKKLASDHMHRLEIELLPDIIIDKDLTYAQFPSRFTAEMLGRIEKTGVVKEGQKIKPGDVLITAVRKNKIDEADRSSTNLAQIHKVLERPFKDASVYWDEIFPGEVYRVVRTDSKIEVHVKTAETLQAGDKLSMSSAAKGTVSKVVPDDKMPHDEKGRHIEIIFNPHGVAGRINPSQTIEQAVGKLVRDGGVKYTFTNFDGINHAEEVKKKLEEKGLSHAESLFDPETGKWLEKPVATGYNYVVKLDHPVRKKFSARGRNSYTLDEVPTSGKGTGGQSYDPLTVYALLGHNAHAILSESVGIRGAKNEDFWRAYQAGEIPPPPKVPFIFNKLENYLNAAGVDTEKHGNTMNFMPMTDKRVLERSNGVVIKGTLLKTRAGKDKSLMEEDGGLFDPEVTGGLFGDKWAHIDLHDKIPHPLYEKVLRDVTGLKTSDFYGLIAHTRHYNTKTGKFEDESNDHTLTGSKAFERILSFDVDQKLADFRERLKTAVGSDRNKYNRATRYLRGLKETGMNPAEAYLTKAIAVLPPKFRGITEMKSGDLRVADSNLLYRDVLMTNEQLTKAKEEGLPADHLADARMALYKSVGALIGVNNALTHRDDREDAKGFIDVIKGKNNKEGFFQRVVARRRNDYTGRSTIEPDSNLGVDEIGIPEDMAWTIYQPTVVRRMSQTGWNPADAMKEVEKRSTAARNALLQEMETRPVLYNRSPSLHRWNISAARATITSGKEIKISPAVIGPQAADFDGDTMAIHVPITDAAKEEAKNLMPSNNLFYDRNRKLAYTLDKDIITGVFALTKQGQPTGKVFETVDEAINDFRNNKTSSLRMSSLVTIKGKGQQSIGWLIFQQIVPARFLVGISPPVDGKKLEKVLENIARNSPGDYNVLTRKIMQAGFQSAAAAGGITATVNELAINRSTIDRLLGQMEKDISKGKTYEDKQKLALEAREKYEPQIHDEIRKHLATEDAGYHMFLEAKPSGKINIDAMNQMLGSPMLVGDMNDRVVPSVIKTGYGGGMSSSDYVLATPGARKGLVAKSLSTALPGFLAKEIAGNVGDIRITEKDCGTQNGIGELLSSEDVDLLDRHLLHDISGTRYKRNDVVTPEMLAVLRDHRPTLAQIEVRSAMVCESSSPPCQMCAGRSPDGKLHPIGSNIGLNYGQGISERSTQLTLRLFHSGGTLGSGDSLMAGFQRFKELLSAPETVRDQGALADAPGRVTNIRTAPQGGYFVAINGTEQHIQQGRALKVKIGDQIGLGDPLSDGSFRPQEIAQKKGMLAAQRYVVNEARQSYKDAREIVRKPALEVLAAGMMRYVEIIDDGGEKDLAIGDVMHENEFESRRKRNPKIKSKPTVPGLSQKPLLSKDLFERLGFQRLEDAIRDVPASAGKSDLTGSRSPLPGIAYGSIFRVAPKFVAEE